MKFFSKEATQYAVLLVFLFAIAAIAVWHTLDLIQDRISSDDYVVVACLIYVITFGFMLIAGAFGLWAIQFASEAGGRRRVGRLVEAMDYIQDGVMAIDSKGRITGSNPATRTISGREIEPSQLLSKTFACLSDTDVNAILESEEPYEIQRNLHIPDGLKTLRFRSQPLDGFSILLVSDVTSMEGRRMHRRLMARLQLIGQIARGVANDFNNLLCAIAGHASLLSRLPPGSADSRLSIVAISKGAERGTTLAAHLLELSSPDSGGGFSRVDSDYLQAAAAALRDSLPAEWHIEAKFDNVPPMSLSGIKIEQVLVNLGLLVADHCTIPGTLQITASAPTPSRHLLSVGNQYAGVLLVAAVPLETAIQTPRQDDPDAVGVIVSVIRTMIEHANGTLDAFRAPDGSPIYRVALPRESLSEGAGTRDNLATELGPYVANWSVLLIATSDRNQRLHDRLRSLDVRTERVDTLVAALARMEESRRLDAIIVDQRLIPTETPGLVRAMIKLSPAAAMVVLCEDPMAATGQLASEAVFVRHAESPERILLAMIEARSLAVKRRPA